MSAMLSNRPNVSVSHPDPLIAIGLATALGQRDSLNVYAKGDPPPAGTRIDVVLTNYEEGLQLAKAPGTKPARIMVLASQEREQEVRRALESGVHGYIMLGCGVEEVVTGIRALSEGRRYLCMAAAQRIADSMSRETLTSRETDVLNLLADGFCNKAIAKELDIAVGTVKAHVKGVLTKLDASSRTQAASIALARGLVGRKHPAFDTETTC